VSSLYVIPGRNRGARYDLAVHEGAITIGRESGNFVQLDDNEVSRRHAEIRRIEGRFVVGDLKSSNGTYVNNRKVEGTDKILAESDLASESLIVLRRGKKKYALLRFE